MTTRDVLSEVFVERARQVEMWGEQHHFDASAVGSRHGGSLIGSSKVAKQRCYWANKTGTLSWEDILLEEVAEAVDEAHGDDQDALREELKQVAAVAVAWIEDIDWRAAHGG